MIDINILNIYMILITLWIINIQLMKLTFLYLWLQWGQLLPNLCPHIILHAPFHCRAGLIDNVEVELRPVAGGYTGWVGVAFKVNAAAAVNLVGGHRVPTPRGGATVVYGDTGGRHCGWGAVTVCVAVKQGHEINKYSLGHKIFHKQNHKIKISFPGNVSYIKQIYYKDIFPYQNLNNQYTYTTGVWGKDPPPPI